MDINRKQVPTYVQFLIENSSSKTSTSRKTTQHLCTYSHLLFMVLKICVTFSYHCTLQDLTFCFASSTFQLTPCSHLWERRKITTKPFLKNTDIKIALCMAQGFPPITQSKRHASLQCKVNLSGKRQRNFVPHPYVTDHG